MSDQQRLDELATGYAIGALNSDELAELHALISEAGPLQSQAIASCWQSLQTTIDLRSVVGKQFEDTVRHRVSKPNGASFVGSVLARIGFRKPGLRPLDVPPDLPPVATSSRFMGLVLGAILVVLAVAWWLFGRNATLAEVTDVRGYAHHFGHALQLGMELEDSLLSVDPGSQLRLLLRDGGQLMAQGPAQITLHDAGLSLPLGRFRIINGSNKQTITLPDHHITLQAHAELEVMCQQSTSQVVLTAGSAQRSYHHQQVAMQPQQVYVQQQPTWTWTTQLALAKTLAKTLAASDQTTSHALTCLRFIAALAASSGDQCHTHSGPSYRQHVGIERYRDRRTYR